MTDKKEKDTTESMNKDQQIGFHTGSLTTLAKERAELVKMVQIVEQLMQMHVKALQELGVDLTKQLKQQEKGEVKKPGKPIEDMI